MKASLEMIETTYQKVMTEFCQSLDAFFDHQDELGKESVSEADWHDFEKTVHKECIKLRNLQRCYATEKKLQSK